MSEYPYLKGVPIVRETLDCWSVEEVMGNFTPHGPSESEKGFAVPAQNFDREKFQALISCWRGLIGRWRSNRWRVMAARHWPARERAFTTQTSLFWAKTVRKGKKMAELYAGLLIRSIETSFLWSWCTFACLIPRQGSQVEVDSQLPVPVER